MNLGQLKGALEALGVWSKKRLGEVFSERPTPVPGSTSLRGRFYRSDGAYLDINVNESLQMGSYRVLTTNLTQQIHIGAGTVATHATTLAQVQTLINDRLSSVDALDPTTATLEDLINAIQTAH